MSYGLQFAQQNLPAYLNQAGVDINAAASRLSSGAQSPYVPYQNERIAPFSQDTQEAQRLGRMTNIGQTNVANAGAHLHNTDVNFGNDAARQYMNPYMENVLDRMSDRAGRSYREQIMPQLESKFVALGQHGGSRHQELSQRAGRDLHENLLRAQSDMMHRGYDTAADRHAKDQARKIELAREEQNLGLSRQGLHFADVEQMERQGATQQSRTQALYDTQYENFLRQQQYPWEQLERYKSALSAMPYSTSINTGTYSFQPQRYEPQSGRLGQIGSLAGQLLGARMMGGQPQQRKGGGSIKRKQKLPAIGIPKKRAPIGTMKYKPKSMKFQPKIRRG